MEAILTSRGRIAIRKPAQDALKLGTDDRVESVVEADRTARLLSVASSVTAPKAILSKGSKRVSVVAMQRAISQRAGRERSTSTRAFDRKAARLHTHRHVETR